MKIFLAFALFAVASASVIPPAVIASDNPEVQEIVAAIQSPSTDPATAAALEQMLLEVLGLAKPEPIAIGPAIVDNYEPISIGPAIVDNYEPIAIGPAIVDNYEPISIGPAIVDNYEPIVIGPAIVDNYEPISVGPAIVDFPLPDPSPVMPAPVGPSANAPLVQIILNIQSDIAGSPVAIENIPSPAPTPVQVVEEAEVGDNIVVEPVIVVDEAVAPEGVIVAQPIIPAPAIVLPDILN